MKKKAPVREYCHSSSAAHDYTDRQIKSKLLPPLLSFQRWDPVFFNQKNYILIVGLPNSLPIVRSGFQCWNDSPFLSSQYWDPI
ncbi:hypothetical protein HET73_04285 [Wolbachia endosymbiont of Atemnus politus]|nr:hypothetical protein [Wolbachia endosymbiont of Atemnus politus]